MQHIVYRFVSLVLLAFCSVTAMAQKDTITQVRKNRDTFYNYKLNAQGGLDSFHHKINIERKEYFKRRDSLRRFDSVDVKFKHFKNDSAFKRLNVERQKLNDLSKLRTDSIFKKARLEKLRSDSGYRKKLFVQNKFKFDSGYKKMVLGREEMLGERQKYLKNLRTDSVRMKQFLKFKTDSLRTRFDSAQRGKKYNQKEISVYVNCKPGTMVFIKNNNRKVIIKKAKTDRVSISTTVNYTDDEKFTDVEWFKKMAIDLERQDTGVVVDINKKNTAIDILAGPNKKRSITIEVPENTGLNIETNNAESQLENDVDKLTANIINGTLKMQNANDVVINGKYSAIKAAIFKDATITLANCKFFAENISHLNIDSKYSIVNIINTNNIAISSISDQYRVEEATTIKGKKDFGKLFLDQLNEQLVLTGANTDVSISTISLNAILIKIDSKYAELKFPVYDLKNYVVRYEGSSRSVNNVYTASQMGNGTGTIRVSQNIGNTDTARAGGKVNQTLFEASAGNTTGKYTRTEIKCAFCSVVFN